MDLKWVKRNVHRLVQQKLYNASSDEKDVMCKMRISTFKMPCARYAYRFFKCFKLQVQSAHRGLTCLKCQAEPRKSMVKIRGSQMHVVQHTHSGVTCQMRTNHAKKIINHDQRSTRIEITNANSMLTSRLRAANSIKTQSQVARCQLQSACSELNSEYAIRSPKMRKGSCKW